MEIVLDSLAVLVDSRADLDAWAEHMAALSQVTVVPLLRSPLRTLRLLSATGIGSLTSIPATSS